MIDKREGLAIQFLAGNGKLQRVEIEEASGKKRTIEHDVSGGLSALITLLNSDAPISDRLRRELARALDPGGRSRLQIVPRLRRGRGRPKKDAGVRETIENVVTIKYRRPKKIADAKKMIERQRSSPRSNKQGRKPSQADLAPEIGESASTSKRRNLERKRLTKKGK